jgi:hypothetical protein
VTQVNRRIGPMAHAEYVLWDWAGKARDGTMETVGRTTEMGWKRTPVRGFSDGDP